MKGSESRIRTLYRVAYWTACALLVALMLAMFIRQRNINPRERAGFVDMVYGRAHKPFVYRALLPGTVRLIAALVPAGAREAARDRIGSLPAVRRALVKLRWEPEYLSEYGIALALLFLSLSGFLLAVRYLLLALFDAPPLAADLAPPLALLGLPPFFKDYGYLYDFPALFLFTLALALMARERWRLFLPVFAATCLNKETAILLTLVFAIHFRRPDRLPRPRYRQFLAVQLVIFLAVKLGLYLSFRDNPGSFVEFHLMHHNLHVLLTAYSFTGLLTVLVFGALVFYRWPEKPPFLRDALWVAVPLLGSTLFLGLLDEFRDYYEAYPILFLLIFHSACRLGEVPIAAHAQR